MFLIALSFVVPASATMMEDAKKFCIKKWDNNYKMIEYCIEKQREAAIEVSQLFKQNKTNPSYMKIQRECMRKWYDKENDTVNLAMWNYCIKGQWGAYKRLNP
jgi:hypothetical protein